MLSMLVETMVRYLDKLLDKLTCNVLKNGRSFVDRTNMQDAVFLSNTQGT